MEILNRKCILSNAAKYQVFDTEGNYTQSALFLRNLVVWHVQLHPVVNARFHVWKAVVLSIHGFKIQWQITFSLLCSSKANLKITS